MKSPNFFIVGAPKCGTTALYEYLKSHPSIFLPKVKKEPHYFCTDISGRKRLSLEAYLSLFEEATESSLAIGEASVWYLMSNVAITNINQFDSDARIIVMLRNPVDAAYSLHHHLYNMCDESEPDFETAWQLQESRRKGNNIPETARCEKWLQYCKVYSYADHLERLWSVFPREQTCVILFDDFIKNTHSSYQEVLRFLNCPDDSRQRFPPVNESSKVRSRLISRLQGHQPRWIRSTKRLLRIKSLGIAKIAGKLNVRRQKRPAMAAHVRQEVAAAFSNDIARTSQLLGRDLSHWVEPHIPASEVSS